MAPYPIENAERYMIKKLLDTRNSINDIVEYSTNFLPSRTELATAESLKALTVRDVPAMTGTPDHGGAVDPNSINMKGIQALFALIGAAFVLGSIWFFFWAKNGGFHFRKGDWEEYKSTVLRRKGPNGTTLSNATKSTKLGGGSIVRDGYSDRDGSTWDGTHTETMTETMTELSSDVSSVTREKIQASKPRKETAKERKIRQAREATWEGGHDNDVRAYRHEKPARVGGINKDSDALHYGTDYTETEGSVMQSHTHRNQSGQGVRQSSARQASPDKRQPSSRRDFSYGHDEAFSAVSSSKVEEPTQPYIQSQQPPAVPPHRPGRYHVPSNQYNMNDGRRGTPQGTRSQNIPGAFYDHSEMQSQHTKSYHHPIPGLTAGQTRGFRRDRHDSLDE